MAINRNTQLVIDYKNNPTPEGLERVRKAYMGLVVRTAQSTARVRGVEFEDKVQEGYIGLLTAVKKFDPSLGFEFSTFALRHIKTAMLKLLRDRSHNIRVPAYLLEDFTQRNRAVVALRARLGREPTLKELHDFTGMPIETLSKLETTTLPQTCNLSAALLRQASSQPLDFNCSDTQYSQLMHIIKAWRACGDDLPKFARACKMSLSRAAQVAEELRGYFDR